MLIRKEISMGVDGSLNFDTKINESGFNSGIKKLGSVAKTGLAAVGTAVAGVVTAFGMITKQSLTSVASLEQNIGGIETLFKNSADKVIKNANNAFKTAGISANQYMENVTSFSAALLQGLGGDTEKAADMADMAMRDMSDNANKMGTDMELIIQTYQSLSRGNYAMLDNLKLGYGGTKAELQRLIKDAAELDKSVDANSMSFDNIVRALHAVQQNMGITGTTAKEAATTIEGSVNSAKAAWDNFLNGSGSADDFAQTVITAAGNIAGALGEIIPRLASTIPQVISALATGLQSHVGEMAATGSKIVMGIAQGIVTGLPGLATYGVKLITQIANSVASGAPTLIAKGAEAVAKMADGIGSNLPALISAGKKLITSIGNGIASAAPTLIPKAVELIGKFAMGIVSMLPTIISTGIKIITSLAQGLINAIPQFITYIPQIINGFCAAIDTGLFQIIAAGIKIIVNLIVGIVQAIPQLIAALPQIILAIINVFTHANLLSAGKALITSLKNGVMSAKGNIINAFNQLTQNIWKKITSTNWLSLGKSIISKLISGVKSLIGNAGTVAKTLATKILTTIRNTNWLSLGKTIITKLISGLKSLAGSIASTAKSLAQRAVTAFKGINWGSVGTNIIKGIIGGIGSAAGALFNKLKDVAGGALNAAKKKLGIKSPSRVFRDEVGKMMALGMGIGFEKNIPIKAMNAGVEGAVSRLKKDVEFATSAKQDKSVGKIKADPRYPKNDGNDFDYDRFEKIQRRVAKEQGNRPIYLGTERIDRPLPKGAVPQLT